jgi:hypothetical protein
MGLYATDLVGILPAATREEGERQILFNKRSSGSGNVWVSRASKEWTFQGLAPTTDYVFSFDVSPRGDLLIEARGVTTDTVQRYNVKQNVDRSLPKLGQKQFRFVPDRATVEGEVRPRSRRGTPAKNALAKFVGHVLSYPLVISPEEFETRSREFTPLLELGPEVQLTIKGKLELTVFENKQVTFDGGISRIQDTQVTVRWKWVKDIGLLVFFSDETGKTYSFSIEQSRQYLETHAQGRPNSELIGTFDSFEQAVVETVQWVKLARLVTEFYWVDPLESPAEDAQRCIDAVAEYNSSQPIQMGRSETINFNFFDPNTGLKFSLDMGTPGEAILVPEWDELIGLVVRVQRGGQGTLFDFAEVRERKSVGQSFRLARSPNSKDEDGLAGAKNRVARHILGKGLEESIHVVKRGDRVAPPALSRVITVLNEKNVVYHTDDANKLTFKFPNMGPAGKPLSLIFLGLPPHTDLRLRLDWVFGRGPVFYFEGDQRTYAYGIGEVRWKGAQANINATQAIPSHVMIPSLSQAREWVEGNPVGLIAQALVFKISDLRNRAEKERWERRARTEPQVFPAPKQNRSYEFLDPLTGVRYVCPTISSSWRPVRMWFPLGRLSLELISDSEKFKTVEFDLPVLENSTAEQEIILPVQRQAPHFAMVGTGFAFGSVVGLVLAGTLLLAMLYKDKIMEWMEQHAPEGWRIFIERYLPDWSEFRPSNRKYSNPEMVTESANDIQFRKVVAEKKISGAIVRSSDPGETLTKTERETAATALKALSPRVEDMPGVEILLDPTIQTALSRLEQLRKDLSFIDLTNDPLEKEVIRRLDRGETEDISWVSGLILRPLGRAALGETLVRAIQDKNPALAGAVLAVFENQRFHHGGRPDVVADVLSLLSEGENISNPLATNFAEGYNHTQRALLHQRLLGSRLSGPDLVMDMTAFFDASTSQETLEQLKRAIAGAVLAVRGDPQKRLALVVCNPDITRERAERELLNFVPTWDAHLVSGQQILLANEPSSTRYFIRGKFSVGVLRTVPVWGGTLRLVGFRPETLLESADQLKGVELIPLPDLMNKELEQIIRKLSFVNVFA